MDKNAISKSFAKALNATLTQVAKEQRKAILQKVAVKPKHLKTNRLKKHRASAMNLTVKITATNKMITPFMLKDAARPYNKGYGVRINRKTGGKFFIASKPKAVSGFTVASGKIDGRDYYYLQKVANLDELALEFTEELQKTATKILIEELQK
ncbi:MULTISPECIES: hypothetical protein [unclassified Campylobacter]|uniref:hypothetical protein n=1 Tax=unclassified Campylobacter TaxID=2593542 RepID=UPI003D352FCC